MPVMQASPLAALDLPLKAMARDDGERHLTQLYTPKDC